MSGEHTPGPWRVVKSYRFINVYGANHKVARLYKDYGAESLHPNAHLIAAAPEMLAALRQTLDYWDSCGFSDCEEDCDCIVQSVQAAIAKAEGRS